MRSARLWRWVFCLPLIAVLAAYANALDGGFVWDDHSLIEEQEVVRELAPPSTYFERMFWSDSLKLKVSRNFYRPLVTWSYALEWQVWNGQPGGFHLTNLLLHLGVTLLVFAACRRAGGSPLAAAIAAALFGTFPRLTESVSWVSGRTDVLSTLFALVAWLLHSTAPRAHARRGLAAVALLLGLFCKEVAAAVLVGIVALEVVEARRDKRPLLGAGVHVLPFAVAVAVYGAFRVHAHLADVASSVEPPVYLPLMQRLGAGLAAVAHYARMLVDPLRPELQIGDLFAPGVAMGVLGGVLLVCGALAAWRWRARLKPLQVGALVAGLTALGMVLHIFPLDVNVLAADRFLYVPLAMGAIAFVRPVEHGVGRAPRAALCGFAVLLVAFVGATHLRNRVWADEYLVWKAAIAERSPGNSQVLQGLAGYLMDEGRYAQALRYIEQGVQEELENPRTRTYNNLAVTLSKLGRHAEAIAILEDMVAKKPKWHRARLNLAMTYARLQRWDEAERQLDAVEVLDAQTVPKLRESFRRARQTLAALPPEREGEPAALTAQRAVVADELGAPAEASRYWAAVVRAPDATPEQRKRGTGFLVFHGDVELARQALGQLRAQDPGFPELESFEEHLQHRASLE
ncbi:tetratricopeptide repeat protein [Archangium sp.]|jgi:tetratricopeptide (TPR) repeat protein|uniref:tetratricopeptide repeat protein n=1 Tax=Archangium sp. TaxID=1872627 RepID=UPI002ED88C59